MYEFGRKFQFIINKIENNTLHISQIIQNNSDYVLNSLTGGGGGGGGGGGIGGDSVPICSSSSSMNNATNNSSSLAYDSSGAAKYIVVVVLVYGFGIIFFIGSQVRSTEKFDDEVDGVNAEKILRSMETEIFTKEVLEKLSDKEHREKAWKIYLTDQPGSLSGKDSANDDTSSHYNADHSQKAIYDGHSLNDIDKQAMEDIEKKLKVLNRTQSSFKKEHKSQEASKEAIVAAKSKLKRGTPRGSEVSDKTLNSSSFSFKMNSSFLFKKNKKNKGLHSVTPLLILQTDVDGLMKLKESKSNRRRSRDKSSSNSKENYSSKSSLSSVVDEQNADSRYTLLSESNEKIYTPKKKWSTKSTSAESPKFNQLSAATAANTSTGRKRFAKDDSNVSFDICEISEQITSV